QSGGLGVVHPAGVRAPPASDQHHHKNKNDCAHREDILARGPLRAGPAALRSRGPGGGVRRHSFFAPPFPPRERAPRPRPLRLRPCALGPWLRDPRPREPAPAPRSPRPPRERRAGAVAAAEPATRRFGPTRSLSSSSVGSPSTSSSSGDWE